MQGQVFLKRGDWHFSYLIFLRFIIFEFTSYFILFKIALCCATIILLKRVIRSCLKLKLKISHIYKLRFISLFVKGFKRLKIDF